MITIISGVTISFLSFAYLAFNMGNGIKNIFNGKGDISKLFSHHIGGMIGMAFGSLVTFLGFIMLVFDIAKTAT